MNTFDHCVYLILVARLERKREQCRQWQKQNPQKVKDACRNWRKNNPDKVVEDFKKWTLENPGHSAANARAYYWRNREAVLNNANTRARKRRGVDINFKLAGGLRSRISTTLRGIATKSKRTIALLGCSVEHLRKHLEKQFATGMTWENYGLKGWHIDHKRPCASFDLTQPEQQRLCFHYTNLQPLWALDNLRKNDSCPT